MANLNLSQFGEKLFVADADHTFIWDTAGAISKRVSRNSWLNSGTLTSDAPVTISQTWNNAAVAFTGLKVNAAGTSGTNSAAGSLLLDLQVGGVSKVSANKDGTFSAGSSIGGYQLTNGTARVSGWGNNQGGSLGGLGLSSSFMLGWASGSDGGNFGFLDTMLFRDGAGQLALRNGANAQTFNVYGTYTSGTSYERLTLSAPSAANAIIGTNKGSGGGTARGLEFQTDGVRRGGFNASGNFDVVASMATASAVYFGPSFNAITSPSAGVVKVSNTAENDFNRLQLGGTTASFPAIKRSTVRIQAVLANDSGFTNIQGKLTTDTDYTAGTIVPTGFLTLYDAQGTAYRVPCVI